MRPVKSWSSNFRSISLSPSTHPPFLQLPRPPRRLSPSFGLRFSLTLCIIRQFVIIAPSSIIVAAGFVELELPELTR